MQPATLLTLVSIFAPILSSKILYLAPINASSHHMWNSFLVNKLAERGHQITYIAAQHLKGKSHPNVQYYVREQSERALKAYEEFFFVSYFGTSLERSRTLHKVQIIDCEEMLKTPPYQNLADPKNDDHYDLMMMEYTGYDCVLPLSQRLGSPPVIFTNALTANPHWVFRVAGIPIFPFVQHLENDESEPVGMWGRLQSLWFYLRNDYDYFTGVQPAMEEISKRYLGKDVLPPKTILKGVSLALVNVPEWMNKVPLTPNIIPVGGLHLTEPKSLSSDLEKFMNEANDGVIIVSFGTCVPTQDLAEATFRSMASALGNVSQKVIWKWDPHMKDNNIVFPKNILRLPWIPQIDILGDPNTRLFVSHCGGQSTLEAVYHGVPVLAVPGFYDQIGNADRLVAEQAALRLNFNEITEENFLKTVLELIEDPKYAKGVSRLRNSLRDQPTKPLDRAIFWIEYVIRNKGAPHLHPLLHNLPWKDMLLLDIVSASVSFVIFVALILMSLMFLVRYRRSVFAHNPKNKAD